MSKNLTRKGLALGAVVALGASLFAGAPAQAAGESITLTSAYGTGTKTILGSTFELSSTLVGWTANPQNLSYIVTGVSAANITNAQSAQNSSTFAGSTFANITSKTDKTEPTSVVIVPNTVTGARGKLNELRFGLLTSAITATTSVTVTAFDDSVNTDGKITAGEIASSPITITFVKPSEVTAVTTLDAPVVGETSVTSHITLGDINLQQVTAGVVRSVLTTNGTPATGANVAWVKDDAALSKTHTVSTIASTDVFSARAEIADLSGGTFTATGTASGVKSSGVGTYEIGVGAITAVTATQRTADVLRSKDTSYAFKAQVTVAPAAAANYKAPAGIPAKVVISGYAGLGTTTLTLGGKTLSASSTANLEFATTTDATGLVNFTIAADKALDGENFVVNVYALDKTSGYVNTTVNAAGVVGAANTKTFTFGDAVATKVASSLVGNQVLATTKGGTVTFDVTVYDQFGKPFSSTKGYKVFAATSGAQASGATVATSALATSGKATISYTDTSTTTGLTTIVLDVFEQTTTTSGVYTATLTPADPANIAVYTVADKAVTVVSGTNSSSTPTVEYEDYEAGDTATGFLAPGVASVAQTLAGSAFAASGAAVPGVPVTVTAAGALFKAGTVWSIGSITLLTDANGAYSVSYYSQKKGKQSLVVTSGSATKTVESSNFAAPAKAKAAKVTITGAASVKSGASSVYNVVVADEFGNAIEDAAGAIKVSVSYTGPGYFTTDLSGIVAAGTKGTLTLTLLAGAADVGAGTLTVTAWANLDSTNTADADVKDNVVATQAIQIGAAPVAASATTAAIAGSTKRFFVSVDGNSSARNVVVKVAGKTFRTLKGAKAKKTYLVAAPKGSHKVTVFVGGKLIATKTIVVK